MSRIDKNSKKATDLAPTGIAEIDRLTNLAPCDIQDYIAGVSAYVRKQSTLSAGPKKAAQIRLSSALARALASALSAKLPHIKDRLVTEERKVAGGLRTVSADVSESHELDGLRLAIELKPINLAVGRALWNRFGDIRTFAVNIHLKFPFAVVGGVLVIPIYEETDTRAAREASQKEEAAAEQAGRTDEVASQAAPVTPEAGDRPEEPFVSASKRRDTRHLIERAIARLIRAGGRHSEADADHLLESIAVVVYDPDTGQIDTQTPQRGSGLRWEEFVDSLAVSYSARFEE